MQQTRVSILQKYEEEIVRYDEFLYLLLLLLAYSTFHPPLNHPEADLEG